MHKIPMTPLLHPSVSSRLKRTAEVLCRFGKAFFIGSLLAGFCAVAPAAPADASGAWDYLGDHPELVAMSTQDWGELGWNTAAHAGGVAPLPIKLGKQSFARGLGHHANGGITIALGGVYAEFAASVGVLVQNSPDGSVIFRVLVDGEERYHSPVVRQADGAVPIRVDVRGGEELLLEALDAGDGITCDMATWADARLLRNEQAASVRAKTVERVNIAPFARVATWDPRRKDGARAKRTEEFQAEDLSLDTDVPKDARGFHRASSWPGGEGCLGLQWLNRRSLSELTLELAAPLTQADVGKVRCEFWTGESAWQGEWKPIEAKIEVAGVGLTIDLAARTLVTQKIRWILPCGPAGLQVANFGARTRSRWGTCELAVEMAKGPAARNAALEVYNGAWLDQAGLVRRVVAGGRSQDLGVRYCRYSANNSDATTLRFSSASGHGFAVAVADVLKAGYVYVPDAGLLVRARTNRVSIAEAAAIAAKGKTVRAEVLSMPDQTLSQAMARTHHEAQHEGPVMLSLAAHNAKWVVESRGDIWFPVDSKDEGDYLQRSSLVRIDAGSGNGARSRHLLGGWIPVPIQALEDSGLRYTQAACVGPVGDVRGFLEGITARVVGLATFDVTNTTDRAVKAQWAWTFLAAGRAGTPGRVEARGSGFAIHSGERVVGRLGLAGDDASGLKLSGEGNRCVLQGELAAHARARCVLWLYPSDTPLLDEEIQKLEPSVVLERTVRYWKTVLGDGMEISTPEPFLNDAIRSSVVRCLIAARQEADGARIAPWIAAMSYGPLESEAHSVVRAMSYFGQLEFARRGLDFFVHRYLPSGMLTTGYTTFGTEWHLWTLAEHVLLHGDGAWLQGRLEAVARAGDWIRRQLEKGRTRGAMAAGRPEVGLMPPGVLADWNAYAYHFCMSAYAYAGLDGLASSFRMVKDPRAQAYSKAARRLREDLLRAYGWTQSRAPVLPLRSSIWIPAYPSQVHSPGPLGDYFPGQDAGRSWCYDVELGAHQLVPTGVLEPGAPETGRLLDHMEDVQFLADGWFDYASVSNRQDWFNLGGFSKVQPYYTRNAEIYAMRGDVKPFVRSYFNSLAAMINPEVMTFWEHFRHSGAWDKTHETGYFLHQTRSMFVMERGNDLELAPLTPDYWLAPGRGFSVDRAPTRFGPVSFSCVRTASGDRVQWHIMPPGRLGRGGMLLLHVRLPEGVTARYAAPRDGKGVRVTEAGPGLLWVSTKGATVPIVVELIVDPQGAAGSTPRVSPVLDEPLCMGAR